MESSKQVQSYKRFDALTSNATRKFVWVSFGDEPHNGNHLSAKKRGCLPQHNIATKVEQQQIHVRASSRLLNMHCTLGQEEI